MKTGIFLLLVATGCHAHLGKDFGAASRAGFEAQYRHLNVPPPLGLDGIEAQNAMQHQRAYGMPDAQAGGQAAGGPGLQPMQLGGAH